MADYWRNHYTPVSSNAVHTIVTGNGFSGNAQRIERLANAAFKTSVNTFINGKKYFVSFKYRTNGRLYVYNNMTRAHYYRETNTENAILGYFTFTADRNGVLAFYNNTVGGWAEIDEVSIQEIPTSY